MKRQILAAVGYVLPEPVNGKVCVIDEERSTYELLSVGQYTEVNWDNFKPEDYTVLTTKKYKCIVNAKPYEKEDYKVKMLYSKYTGKNPFLLHKFKECFYL